MGWMDRAKCVSVPGFTSLSVPEQMAICHGANPCPVMDQCRAFGIEHATKNANKTEQFPVYGGMLPRELAAMAKPRRA